MVWEAPGRRTSRSAQHSVLLTVDSGIMPLNKNIFEKIISEIIFSANIYWNKYFPQKYFRKKQLEKLEAGEAA